MKKICSIATLVALVLGIIFGIFLPEQMKAIEVIGTSYVTLLKVVIGPVIFISICKTLLNKKNNNSLTIVKTVALFIIMFVVTFLITSGVVAIFKPGVGFSIDATTKEGSELDTSFLGFLDTLYPKSLSDLLLGKKTFFVILCALVISLIFYFLPIREKVLNGINQAKKYFDLLLEGIFFFTPFGVFALVGNAIVIGGEKFVEAGLIYFLMAYGCSILTVLLVMILPAWLIGKVNPITYVKKVSRVWLMALSTRSSVATLPYTIRCCNEEFGIDEKITDVVVPLGCTIHMCGGAVSFSLLGLFVAQMNGITVTFPLFMLMLGSATLINMAAPGIPNGGAVLGGSYLLLLGLPLGSFFGFYNGVYPLLDMPYTTLNVTGDITANILLSRFDNKQTLSK